MLDEITVVERLRDDAQRTVEGRGRARTRERARISRDDHDRHPGAARPPIARDGEAVGERKVVVAQERVRHRVARKTRERSGAVEGDLGVESVAIQHAREEIRRARVVVDNEKERSRHGNRRSNFLAVRASRLLFAPARVHGAAVHGGGECQVADASPLMAEGRGGAAGGHGIMVACVGPGDKDGLALD